MGMPSTRLQSQPFSPQNNLSNDCQANIDYGLREESVILKDGPSFSINLDRGSAANASGGNGT